MLDCIYGTLRGKDGNVAAKVARNALTPGGAAFAARGAFIELTALNVRGEGAQGL